jgi:choline dehydrogenase
MTEAFDFIVIGGGTAGCVFAARLSENPHHSVLLLEAGPRSSSLWTKIPAGYFKTVFDPKIGWGYATEPEPNLAGRAIPWPRGKLLGGTGAINEMVYVRGQPNDFDEWARQANTGWGYDDVLPYCRKSERNTVLNTPSHGATGPLTVAAYPDTHPLCEAFLAAAVKTGIPRNPDYNGADQFGARYYQITVKNGLRADTLAAFLGQALQRSNLSLRCAATVTRIVIEGTRAVAVQYRQNGRDHRIKVNAEVVFAAGAVN